ncbi:MAG: hypothetical protein ACTHMS_10200 [Jatrophihabitans sp.]|uniref:hypothetical protein n=1 Tax=Jatrophihabitans sp. TaxID=1932789 RepID=UPI003F81542A
MIPRSRPAALVAGLTAAAAVVAVPAAASAATRHTAAPHHRTHHRPQQARPVTASVHGVVVRRSGRQLTVLADSVRTGRTVVHDVVEHVTLQGDTPANRAVRAGWVVSGDGQVAGRAGAHHLQHGHVRALSALPATVVVGRVADVDGAVALVCSLGAADGHGDGRHRGWDGWNPSPGTPTPGTGGAGDGSGNPGTAPTGSCPGQQPALTVDLSDAALAGAVHGVDQLQAGDLVVALGEQLNGMFAAAQAMVYASRPAFLFGQVVSVDPGGTSMVITPRGRHCGDGPGDAQGDVVHPHEDGAGGQGPWGIPVDLTAAQVVVDGAQDGTLPAVGDEVLVLGADGSGGGQWVRLPLAASFVYAFDAQNTQPVDGGSGNGND